MKSNLIVKNTARNMAIALFTAMFMLFGLSSVAQQDSVRMYKNTIRMNVTNPMIFGTRSLIFGYERQLKNSQSFSVNIGRAYYGTFDLDEDSLEANLTQNNEDHGFNISGDYRFYLKKENKFAAPHGLYIGPYYSYNYFKRASDWTLNTEDFQGIAQTELKMHINTLGFELGYQFLLGKRKRIALDMIMFGPGIATYKFDANINTELSSDDEELLYEALNDRIQQRFPGFNRVIDGNGFQRTGSYHTADVGYRYMVLVGYRF